MNLTANFQPKMKAICYLFDKLQPFTLMGSESDFGRLAILVKNGTLENLGGMDKGPSQRYNFFNDKNWDNQFYLIIGTKKIINETLSKSSLCVGKQVIPSGVYFKWEVVPKDELLSNGLK